jgi:hypothetical protein
VGVSLFFCSVFCFGCTAHVKSFGLYPLHWKVSLRWLISSLRLPGSQSDLARQTSVDNKACFCAGWCSDSACRYRSVCVGFLYTECPSEPSGLFFTSTSRNGKVSCCSTFIVNGCCLGVSGTSVAHPSHGAIPQTCHARTCTIWLAISGARGDPMATPSFCS